MTNSASGTVSVVREAGRELPRRRGDQVGNEPRGCALSENGDSSCVANHTDGTISIIDTSSDEVVDTIAGRRQPGRDRGRRRPRLRHRLLRAPDRAGGPGEGFDDGKEGVVRTFTLANPANVSEITLSPLADSGFTADRSKFCNDTRDPDPVNQTFCPDLTGGPGDPDIVADPQAVFPNQLGSALVVRRQALPPEHRRAARAAALLQRERPGARRTSSTRRRSRSAPTARQPERADQDRADAGRPDRRASAGSSATTSSTSPRTRRCQNFLIVSRGGNYVLRAGLVGGKLDIGAPERRGPLPDRQHPERRRDRTATAGAPT